MQSAKVSPRRARAYRQGEIYALEPGDGAWEELEIELAPDARLCRSAIDELLVYVGAHPFGQSLATALRLGWCRVLEREVASSNNGKNSPVRGEVAGIQAA